MARNGILILGLGLLAWLAWIFMSGDGLNTEHDNTLITPASLTPHDMATDSHVATNQDSATTETAVNNTIDGKPIKQWLQEVANPRYSEDPVLEVASLLLDFRKCKDLMLRPPPQLQELKPGIDQFLSLQNRINQECKELNESYPLWFNTAHPELKILALAPTSLNGESFQQLLKDLFVQTKDFDYDDFTWQKNKLAILMKNPAMTSFAAMDHGVGVFNQEQTQIYMDLLNTQDGLWILTAYELALQSLSCGFPNSRSCEATSFYMVNKCRTDHAACGMNFKPWFQSYVSPGMKKDVTLIINHINKTIE